MTTTVTEIETQRPATRHSLIELVGVEKVGGLARLGGRRRAHPFVFPLGNVPVALVGAVALALAVLFVPLRRAARLRPGDALRYA